MVLISFLDIIEGVLNRQAAGCKERLSPPALPRCSGGSGSGLLIAMIRWMFAGEKNSEKDVVPSARPKKRFVCS